MASAIAIATSSDETNPSADTPPPPPPFCKQSLTAAIHSGAESDDEEEEDLCRICRCSATSEDPLHYPCACRGSIKFVHQNCLLQWINHSSSRRCEVCRHTFSFTPIYAEKAPSRLSLGEQLSWVAAKTWTGSKFLTRLAVVLFVWLVIVPLVAAHFWDMVFIKTPRELGDVHWLHSNRTIFYEILCGQVIFLCTMLVGAALLMCLELLGANRIRLVGGGPNDGALFEENESFAEIIGMRGPAIKLVKHAFQVQLGIALFLVIGVLVPFSWGRIILYQMNGGTRHASDWSMLAVGYISILGPGAIIAGLYMIRRFSKDISLSRSSIMKGLCACRSFVVRMVRQGFILMVVLGGFPCVCGWWFDVCTMKMVQLQFGGLDHLLDFPPLRILVFWGCGILSLVVMKKFLLVIDEELQLQEGILYSLQIPTDINQISIREFTDASLHDNAYRLLLNTAVFMTLTVVLVFLPFKLVSYTLPSFFPLNFILCYSPSGLHWNTLGRLLRSRYVSRHYNPHSAFKFLLHHWLSFVAKVLHLDDFLLPMNEDANGKASTSRFDEVKESQDDQVDSKLELVVKIAALLILGSLSLVLLTSAMIIVPTSLGRAVFSLIMWISAFSIGSNDEINFLVGCYIISDGIVAVRSFINFVGTRRILSVVQLAGKWCMIGLKCFALLSISVLFIPLQLGLLANLMIEMPLDVSIDERPVFYFHHIWVSGCILLSAWIRLVMSGVRDTNSVKWRAKFERVKADGFSGLRALWVVREILCPIVCNLLTWLCVPYIFAKGVFPLLGYSMRTNSSVYHFAWLAYLLLSLLCYIVKRLCICLASLHDRIKDDRYLIGTALCNFQQEDATSTR